MSEELKAIEALADALGFDLVRIVERYEVSVAFAGEKGVITDRREGKCWRSRVRYECNKKKLEE